MVKLLICKGNKSIVEVADAKPGDSQGIASVQKSGWLATYPSVDVGLTREDIEANDFDSPKKLQQWEAKICNRGETKRIWVARRHVKIIGFSVACKGNEKNELEAIYVLPEYHGRGVGGALMNKALSWLGTKMDIAVWLFSHNEKAINFYRKYHFRKSGKISTWPVNGKEIPELEMIKSVGRK